MKMKALLPGVFAAAAIFAIAAVTGDASPKLKAFADALGSASAFSAKYTVQPLGGSPVEYNVALSKPDKARIETPDSLIVADGKTITTYDKNENSYTKKAQTEQELLAALAPVETSLWKAFFKPSVVNSYTSSKDAGTKTRGGKTLNVVNVQADPKGELTMRLYTDQADGMVKQGEIIRSAPGAEPATSILLVSDIGMAAGADLFAFSAPAGAKELKDSDLVAGKWMTNFEEAQKLATQFNKGLIVDFYADW